MRIKTHRPKPLGLLDRLPPSGMAVLRLIGEPTAMVQLIADYSSALLVAKAGITNS